MVFIGNTQKQVASARAQLRIRVVSMLEYSLQKLRSNYFPKTIGAMPDSQEFQESNPVAHCRVAASAEMKTR